MHDDPGNPNFQAGFFEAIRKMRAHTDPASSTFRILDNIIEDFSRGQHDHTDSKSHMHLRKRPRLDQPSGGTTTAAAPAGTAAVVSGATESAVAAVATPAATEVATLRVVISAAVVPETAAPVTASEITPLAADPLRPIAAAQSAAIPTTAAAAAAAKPNLILGLLPESKPNLEQWGEMGLELGIGKKLHTIKGMYLNGEFSIDGRFAATVPRKTPCRSCLRKGLDATCRVPDSTREERISSANCQNCMRVGSTCYR